MLFFIVKVNTLLKAQQFVKFVKNKCCSVDSTADLTKGKFPINDSSSSWKKRLGLFLLGAEDFITDYVTTYETVL